jgi:hypothetical protein
MYVLKFNGKKIDGDSRFCCTGSQLAILLEALVAVPKLVGCTWYVGVLDAFAPPIPRHSGSDAQRVIDMATLFEDIRARPQFLDGVILAVCGGSCPEVVASNVTAEGPTENLVTNSIV